MYDDLGGGSAEVKLGPPTPVRDRLDRELMDFQRSSGPSAKVQCILAPPDVYYGLQQEMLKAIFFQSGPLMFRDIPLEKADIQDSTIIFLLSPYPKLPGSYVAVPVKEWYVRVESQRLSFDAVLNLTEEKVRPEPIWTPTNIRNRKLRN